jgi:hypothetical protein
MSVVDLISEKDLVRFTGVVQTVKEFNEIKRIF